VASARRNLFIDYAEQEDYADAAATWFHLFAKLPLWELGFAMQMAAERLCVRSGLSMEQVLDQFEKRTRGTVPADLPEQPTGRPAT
jgi:hypothetical protein